MLRSMTGYGRSKEILNGYEINIDIRSVNHRYFDCQIKLPKYYNFLEEKIRLQMQKHIKRGKIEVYCYIKQKEDDEKQVILNVPLAKNYYEALVNLKNEFNIAEDVNISNLTRFTDIFETEYKEIDEEYLISIVSVSVENAIDDFIKMREREGERILKDLKERLENITQIVVNIEKKAPMIIAEYKEKLYQKITEVVGSNIDEQRILTEVAIFADKITTTEETVRLNSHLKEFNKLIVSSGDVGKKLDFVVQEMNREANTIGSKSNDLETSHLVVDLKSQIENIREQIQNIE